MSNGPAGFGFVACELSAASADGGHSGGSTPHSHARRREVVVNGTRVKTVDVHAHCAVPEALAILDRLNERADLLMTDTATRIAAKDEQGIDVSALSINPYWYHAERDAAADKPFSDEFPFRRSHKRSTPTLKARSFQNDSGHYL